MMILINNYTFAMLKIYFILKLNNYGKKSISIKK